MDFKQLQVKQYRWDAAVVRHMIGQLTDDLTEDELNCQARPGHHSIWHHIWHMFLSNDYYSADALQQPPVWEEGKWQERLDLTPDVACLRLSGECVRRTLPAVLNRRRSRRTRGRA